MENQNTTPETVQPDLQTPVEAAEQPAAVEQTPADKKIQFRRKLVVIGFVLVVGGWLTMMLNEWVSLAFTVTGVVLSSIGVRIPPGPRRDFAITSIIAGAVLLLVFILFAVILYLI